ncbi:MAG: hypothetical protein RIQ81_290 [Pseudomonadota bacterium]
MQRSRISSCQKIMVIFAVSSVLLLGGCLAGEPEIVRGAPDPGYVTSQGQGTYNTPDYRPQNTPNRQQLPDSRDSIAIPRGTNNSPAVPQQGDCYKADTEICAIEKKILELTNQYRARSGLPALTLAPKISFAARDWSQSMASRGGIGHAGFPSARRSALASEFGAAQSFSLSAENVAMFSYGRRSVDQVAQEFAVMWWNSAGHRRNMLGNYPMLGVGVVKTSRGAYYATQIFGRE